MAEENDPDSVTDVLVGQVLFIRCFDRLKRGSIEVLGYLTTYPSLKSVLTITSHLWQNCDSGRGRWSVTQKPPFILNPFKVR